MKLAKKIITLQEQLVFLRLCKIHHLIPSGLVVKNKMENTLQSQKAVNLAKKQSRQWLILAFTLSFGKLLQLQNNCVFPLNQEQSNMLYLFRAQKKKALTKKFHSLFSHGNNVHFSQFFGNNQIYENANNVSSPTTTGFSNYSSHQFNESDLALLNKGPGFVTAPNKLTKMDLIKANANIHACYDRLRPRENSCESLRTSNLTNFYYNISKLIHGSNNRYTINNQQMKDKATIKKLKNEDVLIYKSDKTNRLVALNSSSYKERLQEAIVETKETKQIKYVTL